MIDLHRISLKQGMFSVTDISFCIPTGSYGVLMGETGCGKTSIIEAICGLRNISSGSIILDDLNVTGLRPACRGVGYVPQDGSLFGSMNVRENLGFALDIRAWGKKAVGDRVGELAEMLGIEALLDRSLKGLSGGERQRIALGRALAFRPTILLLDEPLSAVDESTRHSLCDLLKRVQEETGVTALHVTHSHSEAERLADVLLQFKDGNINSVG